METNFFHGFTRIVFLHRTAFDFFQTNEQGRHFLKVNTSADPDPRVSYIKALLADLVVFPVFADDTAVQISMSRIMLHALTAEFETGLVQPALMDLIDHSITTLCQRSWDQPSDIHWCRLWRSGNYHHNDRISYAVDFLGFAAWSRLDKVC